MYRCWPRMTPPPSIRRSWSARWLAMERSPVQPGTSPSTSRDRRARHELRSPSQLKYLLPRPGPAAPTNAIAAGRDTPLRFVAAAVTNMPCEKRSGRDANMVMILRIGRSWQPTGHLIFLAPAWATRRETTRRGSIQAKKGA